MVQCKPFRMKVRLLNNRLVRAREETGLSQAEAARRMGFKVATELCALENMRSTVWSALGWTPTALRVAEFYGYSPEYLWPEEVASVRKNAFQMELAAAELHQLGGSRELDAKELSAVTELSLAELTPREARVLRERYVEGKQLSEIGSDYGVSRERARQYVLRASEKFKKAMTARDFA